MKLSDIIGDYDIFLENIFKNINEIGLNTLEFSELDHMCYRVDSYEKYEIKKQELNCVGKLISEAMIANRPISIYELKKSIIFRSFKIDYIELPAPKKNNRFIEGLEHVEFVTKTNLDDFIAKHSNIAFDLSSYGKKINPEVVIDFNNSAVKFHEKNIRDVINLQKSLNVDM